MIAALQRHAFPAMAVGIECLVAADERADDGFAAVEEEFQRLEQIFSRFRPDSELSQLNAAGSRRCSDELLEVVELALLARDRTAGRFDPTVHDALVRAGYDRTFAAVAPELDGPEEEPVPAGGAVEVDRTARTVRLGAGVRLDLGGIVKGYAAERGCDLLAPYGPCLVNAGGDAAVRGVPPEGVWPIGVETPAGPLTLGLAHGGLATSGRDYRRWTRNGRNRHHLIDPFTGEPSDTDLVSVTVVGATAVAAEVHAKSLFLLGTAGAPAEAGPARSSRAARRRGRDGAARGRSRMRGDPTFWILARAGGLIAYLLLTCSMLAGLVLKSRPLGTRLKPAGVTDVHRFLALLSLLAIALHGAGLVLDTTVRIDVLGLLVPGRVSYRPVWTGVGVVVAELMLAVYLSFSVRKRIGVRNWRRLHWLTYGIFGSATVHGLLAGSDSGSGWARSLYLGAIGAVVLATAWRVLVPPARRTAATRAAAATEPPRSLEVVVGAQPDTEPLRAA